MQWHVLGNCPGRGANAKNHKKYKNCGECGEKMYELQFLALQTLNAVKKEFAAINRKRWKWKILR